MSFSMKLFGSTPWTDGEESYLLSASEEHFLERHVGDQIHMYASDGLVLRLLILEFLDTKNVLVQPERNVMAEFQNLETLNWGHAKKRFIGLDHLEGRTINILADGKEHPQRTVTAGTVELEYHAVVVIFGLPIVADVETLNLNNPSQGSQLDREKCVFAARLFVEESRGIFAGPDADHLEEYVQREDENYDDPVALKTGLASIRIPCTWEPGGRILIRQTSPLPISILNIMPDFDLGDAK